MKRLYALFLFSLLVVSPLMAQDSYFDFERGLKLSDEQKSQIEDIKKRYLNEWHTSRRDIIKKRLGLRSLYNDPSHNRDMIEKLQNEILEAEISRESLYKKYKGEISKILNEDQRGRYDSFCNSERRRLMRTPLGLRGYGR